MSSRLCIVSRDMPALYGYLMVALTGPGTSGGPDIALVVDRRRPASDGSDAGPEGERRRLAVDDALRARGYAIVVRGGDAPTLAPDQTVTGAPARRRGPARGPRRARLRRLAVRAIMVVTVASVLAALATLAPPALREQVADMPLSLAGWLGRLAGDGRP
jgi:hypothetical protein